MSDLSIPGVPGSGGIDTAQLIEKLMEVERIPLKRMEEKRDAVELEKRAWHEMNRRVARVRDAARSLYGFQNPFSERVVSSSDASVLTAVAQRGVAEFAGEIVVKQTAARDRFLSQSVNKSTRVPGGSYGFAVGDREVTFTFRGGNLEEFAAAVNERSRDLVGARVVRDTADTRVLLIESRQAGSNKMLRFLGQSAELGLSIGMLKTSDDAARVAQLTPTNVRRWEKPLTAELVTFGRDGLLLSPGGEAVVPFSPPVAVQDDLVLEIKLDIRSFPYEYRPPQPPPGPQTPEADGIEMESIRIYNEPSKMVVPEWRPPEPPPYTQNLNVLHLRGDGRTIALPALRDTDGIQTVTVPLSLYVGALESLNVRNANTHKEIQITSVRVFDPASRGDYAPANPIETAGDAVLTLDGIEVRRSSNEIDDLIPGVTLNIRRASDGPVDVKVEPNRTAVKDALIAFVGLYNRLLADINVATGRDTTIIEELTYLTDDEAKTARERLGMLQGNTTLMQLKSRLQTFVMDPYVTSLGSELALLDQIGISTNAASGGGASLAHSRLRGYLEIDEPKLDAALETKMPAVRELFGRDTDNDLVVDAGLAYSLDTYARPYVETGGFFALRIGNLDREISRAARQIETEQEKLAAKEQEYRRKYGIMEGALNTLRRSSQQIESFGNTKKD